MGYPYGKKGWTVYDLETNDLFVSRDVEFFETEFPFCESASCLPEMGGEASYALDPMDEDGEGVADAKARGGNAAATLTTAQPTVAEAVKTAQPPVAEATTATQPTVAGAEPASTAQLLAANQPGTV